MSNTSHLSVLTDRKTKTLSFNLTHFLNLIKTLINFPLNISFDKVFKDLFSFEVFTILF